MDCDGETYLSDGETKMGHDEERTLSEGEIQSRQATPAPESRSSIASSRPLSATGEQSTIPSTRDCIMKEAESFLDSLKGEVVPAGISTSTEVLMRSPEEIEEVADGERQTGEPSNASPSRRESQIWEGAFVEETPRRRKRSRTTSAEDDDSDAPRIRHLGGYELESASTMPFKTSPGIWVSEPGRSAPGISTCTFDVSQEMADAAKRWCEGPEDLNSEASYLRISFCCYSNNVTASEYLDAADRKILETIQTAEPAWSSTCLCIAIGDHVWSPFDLTTQEGPVDISAFIKQGQNELRIIQITDASNFVFLVSAVHPTARELTHAKKKKRFQQLVRSRAFSQPRALPLPISVAP